MLPSYFSIIGALISATGSVAYLIDTLKGKIKPNKVSFLLWSIAPFIAFAAQIKQGVGLESLMTFSAGFFPLVVFLAAFLNKKADWKINRFDLLCGFLSVIGLILWILTKVGNIAIIFSILADGVAALPTIVKAYKYPDTELAWPWIATSLGVVLTLLTISHLNFTNSGFIIYILIADTLVYCMVQFRIGEKITVARNH